MTTSLKELIRAPIRIWADIPLTVGDVCRILVVRRLGDSGSDFAQFATLTSAIPNLEPMALEDSGDRLWELSVISQITSSRPIVGG